GHQRGCRRQPVGGRRLPGAALWHGLVELTVVALHRRQVGETGEKAVGGSRTVVADAGGRCSVDLAREALDCILRLHQVFDEFDSEVLIAAADHLGVIASDGEYRAVEGGIGLALGFITTPPGQRGRLFWIDTEVTEVAERLSRRLLLGSTLIRVGQLRPEE